MLLFSKNKQTESLSSANKISPSIVGTKIKGRLTASHSCPLPGCFESFCFRGPKEHVSTVQPLCLSYNLTHADHFALLHLTDMCQLPPHFSLDSHEDRLTSSGPLPVIRLWRFFPTSKVSPNLRILGSKEDLPIQRVLKISPLLSYWITLKLLTLHG